MPAYKAPLHDIRFLMNEVLDYPTHYKNLSNGELADADTVDMILEGAADFCENVLSPLNQSGDEEGCHFENGNVTTPKGFKEAYDQFVQGGWQGLSYPEQYGGQNLPMSLNLIKSEMMGTANWSFQMYPGLSIGCINTIMQFGTDAQKDTYLPHLVAGTWSGTMCLTEPQCGTDLGQVKTKAEPQADGTYAISGTKIFISAGEHDLTENIIHIVLARLPEAPAGTKGISLFIVPKFLVNADGSVGERNHVAAGSIEHKMGIKGSATCVMNFDAAKGFLVGEENRGLAAMFVMMNYERLSMGIQGIGASEFAYQNAAQYATDRLQGRSATGAKNPSKAADSILVHGDVRRMLLNGRANNEASRAFAVYVAQQLDITKFSVDPAVVQQADDRVALLTPVAKAFLTDTAFNAVLDAQMCFGGHGYIREWGMEQCVRDLRIAQIYEGTNGVQAQDLIGRKVIKNNGAMILSYVAEIRQFTQALNDSLVIKAATLQACDEVEQITQFILEQAQSKPDFANGVAVDYLQAVGLLSFAYMFARMSQAASEKTEDFYQNKLVLAEFFVAKVLPKLAMHVQQIKAGSDLMMQLSDAYFTAQS